MDFTDILSYLEYHPEARWMVFAVVLFLLEVLALPGIGFLFGGLGALTLGGLMAYQVLVPESVTLQIAYFFGFTCLWAAVLWVPFRKWSATRKRGGYNNILGSRALVVERPILPGQQGKVKWSGTVMNAELHKDDVKAEVGETVWIKRTEGSMLHISTRAPE